MGVAEQEINVVRGPEIQAQTPLHVVPKHDGHVDSVQTAINYQLLYVELRPIFEQEGLELHLMDITQHYHGREDNRHADYADVKSPPCLMVETSDIHRVCQLAVQNGLGIMPIGGNTSATNNFVFEPERLGNLRGVLAIKAKESNGRAPQILRPDDDGFDTLLPASGEIIIKIYDETECTVLAGTGVTIAQVNEALKKSFTDGRFVPLDLTTQDCAQIGGIFATGAQGPNRIRPHQVARTLYISDGNKINVLAGDKIKEREGLLGMTDMMVAAEMEVVRQPKNQFGFILPVNSEEIPDALAAFDHLGQSIINEGRLESRFDGQEVVKGIEIITLNGLKLARAKRNGHQTDKDTMLGNLIKLLEENDKTSLLYLTGASDHELDGLRTLELAHDLYEQNKIGEYLHFENGRLEIMRVVREWVPEFAKQDGKTHTPKHPNVYTSTTDINSRVRLENPTPESLVDAYRRLLQPYLDYQSAVETLADEYRDQGVEIISMAYGHANPMDIDPHFRVIAHGAKEAVKEFAEVKAALLEIREKFMQAMLDLHHNDPEVEIRPGEKGIMAETIPFLTAEKLAEIKDTIAAASHNFNFRAPAEFIAA